MVAMTIDEVRRMMLGSALGDALGSPVEFMHKGYYKVTGMDEYYSLDTEGGTFRKLPMLFREPGQWTDDTTMSLITADSLVRTGMIPDYEDIMNGYSRWLHDGFMAANGVCDDIGMGCYQAVLRHEKGKPASESGGTGESSNGNGSLMRLSSVIPLVVTHDDIAYRFTIIRNMSSMTHAHPRSVLGCFLFEEICRELICHHDLSASISTAFNATKGFITAMPEYISELDKYSRVIEPSFKDAQVKGSGYVVDSFEAAIQSVMNADDVQGALLRSVKYGNDNDTNGAITGIIAPLVFPDAVLPDDWLGTLMNHDLLYHVINDYALAVTSNVN
jgi:ADP-ribosylglycohydrolase